MKTTSILILATILLVMSYSPIGSDFNLPLGDLDDIDFGFPEGTFGFVNISNDCDCPDQYNYANDCSGRFFLFEDEFKRIIEIINQSDEPCNYVQGIDVSDKTFEGYLIYYNTL